MFERKKKPSHNPNQTVLPNSQLAQELEDKPRFARRVVVTLIAMMLGVFGLLSRVYYLQVMRHQYYRTRSRQNRVKLLTIPPVRGNIFDRNGIALSENILSYNLVVNRAKSNNLNELIKKIPQYMRFDENDLERYESDKRKKNYNQDVVVRVDLTEKEIDTFLVDLHQFPGFEVVPSYKRNYPYGDLTAHIVGYINNINKRDRETLDTREYSGTTKIGRTGIEKQYESVLHGQAGFRQAEVSRTGKVIRILEQIDAIPGDNLHLSLDIRLQAIIRDVLEQETYDGAGVAIDPRNGEMLAMFSNPSFDANLFVDGISYKDYEQLRKSPRKNLFNRALNGNYSPASTIKPMMSLAALHHYIVTPNTEIECGGSYRIPEYKYTKRFYCWKRSGHGNMNTISSVAESCDVYYYNIGKELGIARINSYLSQFGLGKKTGIDLPNESSGILPDKEWKIKKYKKAWFVGDTINASIGQGYMLTTPLQLAYFTAILASRGKRYRPHFVTRLDNPISGQIKRIHPQMQQVEQSNPNAWNVVSQSMIEVMRGRHGTARKVKVNLPFKIAGKTGTAQVISLYKGKRKKKEDIKRKHRDNSVFIAYAPADKPVIALSIILENAGGGSKTAAPIAVKILERYFKEQPKRQEKESDKPAQNPIKRRKSND